MTPLIRTAGHVGRNLALAALSLGGLACAAGAAMFSMVLDTESPMAVVRRSTSPSPRTGHVGEQHHAYMAMPNDDADLAWFNARKRSIRLLNHDHMRMHAWGFVPEGRHRHHHCYVICVHGYSGNPSQMAPWARHFASMGLAVLVPALRAHELSDGRYIGMGWAERLDLMTWIRKITADDPRARIVLCGVSMGATAALMTLGERRLPNNVRGVVADSAFADEYTQLVDSVRSRVPVPCWLARAVVDAANVWNRWKLGYSFEQASAVKGLASSRTPVLFVHGGADDVVDPHNMDVLYDASASADKERLFVPGAGHVGSRAADARQYWVTVDGFVRRCLRFR